VLLTLGLLDKVSSCKLARTFRARWRSGWGIASLERNDLPGLYLGAALGALMTFNAFWSQRRSVAEENEYPIRPVPTYFTLLALASWLAANVV